MIVEFLGNTGAGKSTLVPILTGLLRDESMTAMSATEAVYHYTARTLLGQGIHVLAPKALRGPILWRLFAYLISKLHMVRFSAQNPRLVRYVIRLQLRRPIPWRHRWLIVRLFFRMACTYSFLRSRAKANEFVILDEGLVHRVVHMFVSASEPLQADRVVEYLRWLPRSDLVICVKSPREICLARIQARGLQIRLANATEEDVARFVANGEQVVDMASRYLKDAGWSLVEITNDGDLSTCATQMRDELGSHLDGQQVQSDGFSEEVVLA
jgi:thymidylate kinase